MGIGKKRIYTTLLTITIIGMGLLLNIQPKKAEDQSNLSSNYSKDTEKKFKVARVIDGDTIVLENGQRVRYIGINTPELRKGKVSLRCFANKALEKNKELVEGQSVTLEKDVSETDKYNRLLRYVFIGGIFVNEYLVREGYAKVSTFPPDVKYQKIFINAEKEAREKNKGLWSSSCKND